MRLLSSAQALVRQWLTRHAVNPSLEARLLPSLAADGLVSHCRTKALGLVCVIPLFFASGSYAQDKSTAADLSKQAPAEVFGEKCGMCHRGNGMGSTLLGRRYQGDQAQLENRVDLQPQFIETVVRAGLGVMYPISRGEVSDEQLAKIKQHLVKQGGAK